MSDPLSLGRRFNDDVLAALKQSFVGKDEVIDLLGVSLVACENLFILGPPGTAKSALVQELAARIHGRVFDYLLTRFTEPNELFGPFDIRKLRDGDLVTNTEGMLPEADFVFLDELLNANSAILNSLLMVLNERVFRRGRETRRLPTLTVVGASNRLPDDDALGALFDRFLLRVRCDNVSTEQLSEVLVAGWRLDTRSERAASGMSVDDLRRLHELLREVNLDPIRPVYGPLVQRIRHAGLALSDRRAVKLQRMLAASALLCGRLEVNQTDFWVLRYIWDTEEQQEVLAGIVADAIAQASSDEQSTSHPRARGDEAPDADLLDRDLDALAARFEGEVPATEQGFLRDQLGLLADRCQWVATEQQRAFLQEKIDALWKRLGV